MKQRHFTNDSGQPMTVNRDLVRVVKPYSDDLTAIYFDREHFVLVKADYTTVINELA